MARRISAAIVLYRRTRGEVEVLLVHPGGPFWARRDAGAWSFPKGEHDASEDSLAAALREFEEELGQPPPAGGAWTDLDTVVQKGGKVVRAWAGEGDLDPGGVRSATFEMEWPPRSGRRQAFPEVDRAGWFTLEEAAEKVLEAQREFLERLQARLGS